MRGPLGIVLGAAVVLLGACTPVQTPAVGPPQSAAGSAAPAGIDLVFKMQNYLGFSPPNEPVQMPLAVYRDGRLIQNDPAYRKGHDDKALPQPQVRMLTPAGLEKLLKAVADAGLTTITDYGDAGVMDVGPTKFTVVSEGRLRSILVEGADYGPLMQGDPMTPVREKLMAFRKDLRDLDSFLGKEIGAPQPYRYDKLALTNRPLGDNEPMPGVPVTDWPLPDPSSTRCVVVTGDTLTQAAQLATQTSIYAAWKSNAKLYYIQFRPLLPDENDCQSVLIQ